MEVAAVSPEVVTTTAPPPPPRRGVLKRFVVNVASLFSLNVANMLLPLLTVPYVVRIIGPERLGLLNFSQAFVTYFTLLINFGFDTNAVRTIAANRGDQALLDRVFSEVMTGKALLWGLSTVIFAGVSAFVPEFRAHWLLHVCTYFGCLGIVLFPVWLYQAMEDLGRVALFNSVIKVLVTLSVFVFIRQADDYLYQNLSLSIAQVVVGVVAFFIAVRRFGVKFSLPTVARMQARFRHDSTLFFTSVVATLYAGSNVFLLGLFSTVYSVGIFSAGTRIVGITQAFVALALNQAFFPIVAAAFGRGRDEGLNMVRKVIYPVSLLMVCAAIGLWVIAPYFIPVFYGEKFAEAILVMRVVAVLPITMALNNLMGAHVLLNLRMDRAFFRITALGPFISLTLNALLIQRLGHLGVAWAWVLTELCMCFALYAYLRTQGVELLKLRYLKEAIADGKQRLALLTNPSK